MHKNSPKIFLIQNPVKQDSGLAIQKTPVLLKYISKCYLSSNTVCMILVLFKNVHSLGSFHVSSELLQ